MQHGCHHQKQLKQIDGILPILATSNAKEDDILIEIAKKNNILYFRGDLKNVSKRVFDCIAEFKLEGFFRINGDSPIIDKFLIEKALTLFPEFDFITNLHPRSYPYGISVELISAKIFSQHQKNFNEDEQEHITKYFYKNQKVVNTINLMANDKYNTEIVLTIDDMDTYLNFWKIYNAYPNLTSLEIEKIITIINKIK